MSEEEFFACVGLIMTFTGGLSRIKGGVWVLKWLEILWFG